MLQFSKDRLHIEESIEWHKQIVDKYKALYHAMEDEVAQLKNRISHPSDGIPATPEQTTKCCRLEIEMLELYKANDIKQKALDTWTNNLKNYQAMLERNAIEVNGNWNNVFEEARKLSANSGSLQLLLQQWEDSKNNEEIKKQFTQQEILNQMYFALKHEVDVARKKK